MTATANGKIKYVEEEILPELLEAFRRGDKKYYGIRHWNSELHMQRSSEEDIRHVRELHTDVRLREAEDAITTGDIELAKEKIVSAIGYLCILHARINEREKEASELHSKDSQLSLLNRGGS